CNHYNHILTSSRHTTVGDSILFDVFFFFFNAPPPTEIYTLSLHDALPISRATAGPVIGGAPGRPGSVTRSPERSSSNCRRDEGVPLRLIGRRRPRRHPPISRSSLMNSPD